MTVATDVKLCEGTDGPEEWPCANPAGPNGVCAEHARNHQINVDAGFWSGVSPASGPLSEKERTA